jgi:hypothetical protein
MSGQTSHPHVASHRLTNTRICRMQRAARDTFDALGAAPGRSAPATSCAHPASAAASPPPARWTCWHRKNCRSRGWLPKG